MSVLNSLIAERPRCDQAPAWAALQTHFYTAGRSFDLRDTFAADRRALTH